jgi:NitT/TauT family transport system permease protein
LPNSVPYLVAGAKVSCGLSVIGSIVGETFAGWGLEARGLGAVIHQASGRLQTDYAFAALLTSALLGVAMFGCVSLLGDWIVARRGGERA